MAPYVPHFFSNFPSKLFFQTVTQMRWHLSVTHQSFLRTHFSLALSTLVQVGLIPPLASSRCGQSEPTSRTWLGVVRTNIFPREVVPGSKPRTDGCPLPYPEESPPQGGTISGSTAPRGWQRLCPDGSLGPSWCSRAWNQTCPVQPQH